jgi:hypothetical protein
MMDASKKGQQSSAKIPQTSEGVDERLRAIAYSMDVLIPGLYIWLGPLKFRIGGSLPEATYPGTIHSPAGIALVLPGYRIYTTYLGSYDPR